MLSRVAILTVTLASSLCAQFSGLSSTSDGSALYFASTLRFKNTPQPRNGKIFVAQESGITLFRARDRAVVDSAARPCTVGGFADYLSAETSATGAIALTYRANSAGGCSFPVNPFLTELTTTSSGTDVPGIVRLNAAGTYAITFLAATGRPFATVDLAFLDLKTGVRVPIPFTQLGFSQYLRIPTGGGRIVADDGTALLALTDGSIRNNGFLVKPGADPQPFPIADGLPLEIDASASKVLYQREGLRLLDLRTTQSTLLIPLDQPAYAIRMSDDARRLLFLQSGQVHLLDTTTLADRTLTGDSAQIVDATLSGDGSVVFAVTGNGRLLKIQAGTGAQLEVIGRTPYLDPVPPNITPGLTSLLTGSGLSDRVIDGAIPYTPYLGNITMWIGERKVPVIRLTPTSVAILAPWDLSGPIRILAEVPGDHTPFDFPDVETVVGAAMPRAGAILRQDNQPTYSGPVNTGEVIHVYAVGLGAVAPEVPDGAAAPAAEPFSRLSRTLACSNAQVIYAGLAPGTVERVYQVDLRIGRIPGYQQFTCTLDGTDPFLFLTLNVVAKRPPFPRRHP